MPWLARASLADLCVLRGTYVNQVTVRQGHFFIGIIPWSVGSYGGKPGPVTASATIQSLKCSLRTGCNPVASRGGGVTGGTGPHHGCLGQGILETGWQSCRTGPRYWQSWSGRVYDKETRGYLYSARHGAHSSNCWCAAWRDHDVVHLTSNLGT